MTMQPTEWRLQILAGARTVEVNVWAPSETAAVRQAVTLNSLKRNDIEGSIRGVLILGRRVDSGPWIPWQPQPAAAGDPR
jgi:hypothetical protein